MTHIHEIIRMVQQRFGLVPRHRWDEYLLAAVAKTASARGVTEEQLLDQIAREPALLSGVVGTLTVGESYFFRHPSHFDMLVVAARGRLACRDATFSIWSAGCAAGEEPYSIALALRHALPGAELARVSIVATDLDADAITRAGAGLFPRWAFRDVADRWLTQYFHPRPADHQELRREVRRQVAFRHAALQEHLAFIPQAGVDVVFFRNVSVYLTAAAIDAIYRGFAYVLRPGGLLFVAPTDARPQLDEFRPFCPEDSTVFERRVAAGSRVRAPEAPMAISQHAVSPVLGVAPNIGGVSQPSTVGGLRAIDALANRGDLAGALALLTERLAAGDAAAELYQRRGSLLLALGNVRGAVDDYRRVLYLEPENHVARYSYALALRQVGERDLARHHLIVIADGSAGVPDELRSSAQFLVGELA